MDRGERVVSWASWNDTPSWQHRENETCEATLTLCRTDTAFPAKDSGKRLQQRLQLSLASSRARSLNGLQ